jgi:hypothetical protein
VVAVHFDLNICKVDLESLVIPADR